VTKTTEITLAISDQAKRQSEAITELAKASSGISEQGVSILQLLGGSIVLGLLGYLGLHRLQTIDAEVQTLREFMFRQIKERIEETHNVLRSVINDEISARFQTTTDGLSQLSKRLDRDVLAATNKVLEASTQATERVSEVELRVKTLLEKYSWLSADTARSAADRLNSLASVAQAETAAEEFNRAEDHQSAKLALESIARNGLPGNANSFHNAISEAMRMKEPGLSLSIAQEGLKQFPEQYDLIADKAVALISMGSAGEAVEVIEKWRVSRPDDFCRSWRPVVFYFQALELSSFDADTTSKLREAFAFVTSRSPYEIKVWSNFAKLEQQLGGIERASTILKNGLSFNPFSQELNYDLGELLLSSGNAKDSLQYLTKALTCDFQEQYQHDMSQAAVICTLAQAYEWTYPDFVDTLLRCGLPQRILFVLGRRSVAQVRV
jgi:tetratricopeptide (TPR) repeat protein